MSNKNLVKIKNTRKRDPEGGRHRSGSGLHDNRPKRKRTRQKQVEESIKEFYS